MSVQKREHLKNASTHSIQRISEAERESTRPFGRLNNKGRFIFNIDLVPHYNVPELDGCKLKPYVAYVTPIIPEDIYEPSITELSQKVKDLKLSPESFEPAQFKEETAAQ
mmetsp:Transcript_14366/g.16056  ORF Transcript_14366/g.16056 Transcript_14366/m.16056 type:complete len:110 (-) Transcript_14366:21-350(-)